VELTPKPPRGRRLEGGQRAQQQRQYGEDDQGGDRHRQWDERQAEHRHNQPGDAYAADAAKPEAVVPEKVEGDDAAQRNGRDRRERVPDVREPA